MADHTPGPWTAEEVPSLEHWHVFSPEDGLHCTIMFEGSEADANLIAAAPDLLAALEELEINCNMYPDAQYHKQARAAIAKARGQK